VRPIEQARGPETRLRRIENAPESLRSGNACDGACDGSADLLSWNAMATNETHGAIDAVWRIESPRLIASLVRMVRDIDLAEDLAQDALVAALEQ
jgi:hypothetical protein